MRRCWRRRIEEVVALWRQGCVCHALAMDAHPGYLMAKRVESGPSRQSGGQARQRTNANHGDNPLLVA